MKRKIPLIALVFGLAISGCQKKNTSSKIMDNFPVNAQANIIPAKAAQEWAILNNQISGDIVGFLTRLQTYFPPSFPELTDNPPGYQMTISSPRFGTAMVNLVFIAGGSPVSLASASSNTITEVDIAILNDGKSQSDYFSYHEALQFFIQTPGDLTSLKYITGQSVFTGIGPGAGYNLTFTIDSSGMSCSGNGLIGGSVSATGSGPTDVAKITALIFDANHFANGSISWEGEQGQIHINSNGGGIVLTSKARIPID